MLFSETIPAELLMNPNVAAFVKVLDGMMLNELSPPFLGKMVEMEDVKKSFDPVRMDRFNFYQFMLYEMGKIDWMNGFPKEVYERLAMNGYGIMAQKGSLDGLKLLASSLWLGDVAIDGSGLWSTSYIMPSDLVNGFLPGETELRLLYDHEREFLYVYNGDTDYYNSTVEVRMISPLFYNSQFRTFVASVLGKYLPMFDPLNTNYTFRFYGFGFVGNKLLYYTPENAVEIISTPVITLLPTTISAFEDTPIGSSSVCKNYNVSGADLTSDIVITAPTHFEISFHSNNSFGSTLTLSRSGGVVGSTTIFVRFSPTTSGVKSGNVTHVSSGAVTKNMAVSGNSGNAFTIDNLTPTIDDMTLTIDQLIF